MKKLIGLLVAVLMVMPLAMAVDIGTGIGIDMETEDFEPLIWMCDHRLVFDDNVETGRWGGAGSLLRERLQNYAFEGEQIMWIALVMDKNGIEKIEDVYVTVGDMVGVGNDIEVNCDLKSEGFWNQDLFETCNARIDEEELTWEDYLAGLGDTMAVYVCTFTVETPDSMYGEYWVTGEVTDLDGLSSIWDENEYWFFNPEIALSVDGSLDFGVVRPGTVSYSPSLLVGNAADEGSGVMLDMFISGTDFYDPSSSGAKCPMTNQLSLTNFRYYAVAGASSTQNDMEINSGGVITRDKDVEGYVNIEYGNAFTTAFYDDAEIIQVGPMRGPYYRGNVLSPGSELALTFKLSLPEPCNGDFTDGSIFFWGEAV
jgi:hypothetical protein